MSASSTRLPSAAERAYSHLKTGILDGSIAPGVLVTEGDVAEELGVSRTPIREALLRLEVEGLVALYPKKGALVIPVSADEARDVLEAREVIEVWAAGRAWSRRHDLVERLKEHLKVMKGARTSDDVAGFSEADRSFHEEIVAAAGNLILTKQYRMLRERQLCVTSSAMRVSRTRMDRAVRQHGELISLLEEGTKSDFLAAIKGHLEVARQQAQGVR
ncbi:MAG TPA: GntR family transcriptional regulator [Segeticoccus sp.]|uniref:GntR family transcriptional regulator n=1 Tax=Segeticoccus sp. TaxID=2706531 RepID=UPI002D80F520|nr:GntR family transcriptional regulator [Segeticoccus sp.]HET8599074.1 GntR family transcriptional regulator [Segeticoccus sp.]